MEISKLGNWLQVSANLGIVLGLVLVGVQLKQNSDLLKTQLLYAESQRMVALETQVVGENGAAAWAKAIEDPTNLSLEETRIIEALLWSYAEQLRSARLLGELGLLNEQEWQKRVRSDAGFMFGNPYGRAWWVAFSDDNDSLSADLIAAVDERLEQISENHTFEYILLPRNSLREAARDTE